MSDEHPIASDNSGGLGDPADMGDLGALLRRTAPPALADDGFSARVLAALPAAPPLADRTGWLTPAEALRRETVRHAQRQRLLRWTRGGILAGTAIAAATWFGARPLPGDAAWTLPGPSPVFTLLLWTLVTGTLAAVLAQAFRED